MPTFDAAQLHLALNHLPVVGVLIATGVLVVAAVARRADVQRFGLVLLALAALTVVPVYLTGEPAEEAIEERPGVSEALIERHEEAAESALAVTLAAGAIAAAAWLAVARRPGTAARALSTVALVGSLAATASLARVAHLGGAIRHEEIRSTSAVGAGSDRADEESVLRLEDD